MLANMKIGTKLFVGFFLMVLLLLVVGGAGWYGLYQLGMALLRTDRASTVLNYATEAEIGTLQATIGTLRYAVDTNEATYKEVVDANNKVRESAKIIVETTLREEVRDLGRKIGPLADEFGASIENLHKCVDAKNTAEDARRAAGSRVTVAFDELEKYYESANTPENERYTDVQKHLLWYHKAYTQRERAGRFARDVQLFRNPAARDKAEQDRIQAIQGILANMAEILSSPLPDEEVLVKTLSDATDAWDKRGRELKEIIVTSTNLEGKITEVTQKIMEIASEMDKSSYNLIEELAAEARQLQVQCVYAIFAVAAFAVVTALAISFLLTRDTTGIFKEIIAFLGMIAKEGDLSHDVPPHRLAQTNEVGQLAVAVQAMLLDYREVEHLATELAVGNWTVSVHTKSEKDSMNLHLAEMVGKINVALKNTADAVNQVAEGAMQVASASESLSQGATESAASIEEITASMSEIGGQTNANAQSATDANRLAKSANDAAQVGQEMMQKMISSMESITKNATDIQKVIKVIDDISFQTNLLALNAAVEAARAGVHGKGFAVVAEEVRNLAARSAKAAAETTQMIEGNSRQISAGADIASQTAAMLNDIVSQVTQVTEIVGRIATASSEQAQGVGQVTQGLHQIDAVTQQNTANAEETASVSNEMSSQAKTLQQLIAQFRLK